MKKLVWLAALYAPLLFAAPKLSKELSAKFEIANKKVASFLVNDENQKALEYIAQVLSEIPADTDTKALKQDKNYSKLIQSKGDALIADANYKEAEAFYTDLCKDLKAAEKKKCEKPIAVIKEIQGTTLDFLVSNPGPLTEIYFVNKSERFCFLSDDPSLAQKTDNCKVKNKVKAKPNPYKGTIKRAGFGEQKFSVLVEVNKQNKTGQDPSTPYVLVENPAKLPLAPFPENAMISIDGKPSTTSSTLAAGEHFVTVSAEGYVERKEKFLVKEGVAFYQNNPLKPDQPVSIKLNPYITLSFDSPKEIQLYENGAPLPPERLNNNRLELPDGKVGELVAKAPGFRDEVIPVANPLVPGEVIAVSLDANQFFFSVVGAPQNTTLNIDKKSVALNEQKYILQPNQSSYTFSLQNSGYKGFEETVTVKADEEVIIQLTERKKWKSPLGLAGIALGGVGAVSAGAFGFLALQERNKIEGVGDELGLAEQECVLSNRPDLDELPPEQASSACIGNTNQKIFFDASKKRKTMALVSDASLGVAAIGGGLFVVSMLIKQPLKGTIEVKKRETTAELLVSPSSVALSVEF